MQAAYDRFSPAHERTFRKVRLYFTQRTRMRVLCVKYDGTFFHRPIKSRVRDHMQLA